MLVTRVLTLAALRRQWGFVVGLVAVLGARGGFRVTGLLLALLAVLAVSALLGLVEWLRTTYSVAGGRLVVERGLLTRSLTVIPLDRVRGVDVQASALQRLLGIASVRVDAAATGGKGDEAVLDSVSAEEARWLRDLLLRQAAAAHAPVAPPPMPSSAAAPPPSAPARQVPSSAPTPPPSSAPAPPLPPSAAPAPPQPDVGDRAGTVADGEVLARFRPRWLLYAPLVGTYLLAPLAAVAAAAQLLDDVRLPVLSERRITELVEDGPSVALILLLALALVVLSVLGSLVTAAVANWGFTLTRHGGTLVAERGLLSRRQVSLEHDRIRGYALAEPLLLRLAGAGRLTALVTGLGGGDDGARGRRGQLLPLGPVSVARQVAAAAVLPFRTPLRPHPPAARRRRLVRATLPWLAAAAVLAALRLWPAATAALALAALGVPLGLDRYAGLGHGADERAVSVRSGSLRRSQVVLERRGVVGWRVRQSPFQRRAGLATVTPATGAGAGGYDAVDVGVGQAAELMRTVDARHTAPLLVPDAGATRLGR
jgi:putative membrane protein